MNPIKFRTTVVDISPKFKRNALKLYGEDLAPLMLESVKHFETKTTRAQSKVKRFFDQFRTHSKLYIFLDTDKKGDFLMKTVRTVGKYRFDGKIVKLNLLKTLDTLKDFENSLLESKEGILEKITQFNQSKKLFKI